MLPVALGLAAACGFNSDYSWQSGPTDCDGDCAPGIGDGATGPTSGGGTGPGDSDNSATTGDGTNPGGAGEPSTEGETTADDSAADAGTTGPETFEVDLRQSLRCTVTTARPFGTIDCSPSNGFQRVTCESDGEIPARIVAWRAEPSDRCRVDAVEGAFGAPGTDGTISVGRFGKAAFEVRFSAVTPADLAFCTVTLVSPGLPDGVAAFPFDMTGFDPRVTTDRFDIPVTPIVDLLWVVDNSSSMGEEQAALAANINRFIGPALDSGADLHVGVTTTEIVNAYPAHLDAGAACGGDVAAGHLYSCPDAPPWVETSTPNARAQLGRALQPGTCCSDRQEAPLEAAKLVFTEPNLSDPGINGGFYRQNARLVLVFVTDEEDQSDSPIRYYVDFFRQLKGQPNPDQVAVAVVSGFDPKTRQPAFCTGPYGDAQPAEALYDFARQIENAEVISICEPDWVPGLEKLDLAVFMPQRAFPLSRPVAERKWLRVTMNGAIVPPDETGNGSGWTYDAATNTVRFGDQVTIPPGARVEALYFGGCF